MTGALAGWGWRSASAYDEELGVGGEQGLGEDVVEGPDPREGDHDRLVDRPPDARGAARCRHALVAADDRDDRSEQGRLHDRAPEVGDGGVGEEGRPKAGEVLVV